MSLVTNFSLGKNHRLFIGNTAAAATDAAYTMLENENDLKLSYKAEVDSVNTKSGGKITIPSGDESYSIKGSADAVFTDPAYALLISAKNLAYPYQIRDVAANKVIIEGAFVLSDFDLDMGEKGARKTGFTLENAGVVTLNLASPRAVTA